MTFRDQAQPRGRVLLTLHDATGRIHLQQRIPNLITTAGRSMLANMFISQLRIKRLDMVIGEGDTAPAIGDVALTTPVDRQAANHKEPGDGTEEDEEAGFTRAIRTISATFNVREDPAAQDQTIQEAGILAVLDDDSEVLYNRVVFGLITRSPKLALTLDWDVLF
jgi:hypothetical protein